MKWYQFSAVTVVLVLWSRPPFPLGRVVFDNATDATVTLIKVDSANSQSCLLEVVQLLTDLDLIISKAYVSSDGSWFADGTNSVHQQNFKAP